MQRGASEIIDKEFGVIKVRRTSGQHLRLRVGENGQVSASLPWLVSLRALEKFLEQSRASLRKSIAKLPPPTAKISETERKKLKKQAEFWLKRRLFALAAQHGLKYQKVRIMNAKTRWGSYSIAGTVSLNYALMKVPETLRDYVILHELTHTLHMNHSKQFWSQLAEYYPNYKQARRDIKKYSPYL